MGLKSGYKLEDGEQLVMEIEANMRETSSNPLAVLWDAIRGIFELILGFSNKGFLVMTNKRVVMITKYKAFFVIEKGSTLSNILPHSVSNVGYSKMGTCCCGLFCKKYQFFFTAAHEYEFTLFSSTDEDAKAIVDAFYNALTAKA